MVEPQVDGVPVVVQGGLVDATAETRVERVQRRLQAVVRGTDGPGTGKSWVRVVRTTARAVPAAVAPAPYRAAAAAAGGSGAGAAVGAYGAGRRPVVRGRVRRITAAASHVTVVIVSAAAAAAATAPGAVSAAATAPRAVPAAPRVWYALRHRRPCPVHIGVRRRRRRRHRAYVAGPNWPRYAVRAYVDDALLDR